MKMKTRRVIVSCLIFAVLISSPLRAMMIKLSLSDLVRRADAIIIGQVKAVGCEWSLNKEIIHTVAALQIEEILKGDLVFPLLYIQVPGGTIGDLTLGVSDVSVFAEGERVLVFIKSLGNTINIQNSMTVAQNSWASFEVLGKAQGKYSLDKNGMASKDGYELVSPDKERDTLLPLEELKFKIQNFLPRGIKKVAEHHEI